MQSASGRCIDHSLRADLKYGMRDFDVGSAGVFSGSRLRNVFEQSGTDPADQKDHADYVFYRSGSGISDDQPECLCGHGQYPVFFLIRNYEKGTDPGAAGFDSAAFYRRLGNLCGRGRVKSTDHNHYICSI